MAMAVEPLLQIKEPGEAGFPDFPDPAPALIGHGGRLAMAETVLAAQTLALIQPALLQTQVQAQQPNEATEIAALETLGLHLWRHRICAVAIDQIGEQRFQSIVLPLQQGGLVAPATGPGR